MSRKALEDLKYETIKAHMLDPEHSPLPLYLANLLELIVSLSKILYKNPLQKQAIALFDKDKSSTIINLFSVGQERNFNLVTKMAVLLDVVINELIKAWNHNNMTGIFGGSTY